MAKRKKKAEPKIKDDNYYGFDHEQVSKQFEGNPTFVGYFNIRDKACAVYHSKKPNREKNHKDYMFLYTQYDPVAPGTTMFVSGMDADAMAEHSEHPAVLCGGCNTILYSLNRHHFHKCGCPNETFVDGGKDYLRFGGKDLDLIETGTLDVLSQTFCRTPRPKA